MEPVLNSNTFDYNPYYKISKRISAHINCERLDKLVIDLDSIDVSKVREYVESSLE